MNQFTPTTRPFYRLQQYCIVAVVAFMLGEVCVAQTAETNEDDFRSKKPEVSENIGIDSMTGDTIPMDLQFRNTDGVLTELGALFDGKQPVMLSFNYSDCPKLCSTQLQNMTQTLRDVAKKFKVDDHFQMISISIDPNEQTIRLRETQEKYIKQYNQPGTEGGWHFMTGKQAAIKKLADACGFRYRYIARQKYYSHPPVFILLSPTGKIVRYIHGLKYDSATIEQALVESAEGKIGSPINWLSYGLGCYVYDESSGQYNFQSMLIMKIGGAFTVLTLLVTLIPYWFFSSKSEQAELTDEKKNTNTMEPAT